MEWIILMALIRPGIPSNMPTYTKQTNNVVIFWQKGKEKEIEMELSLQGRCCTEGHRTSPRCTETWHCHGPHWLSRWFSYHALAIASTKIIRIHQIEIKTLLLLQSMSLHILSFLQNVVQVKCNTLMSLDWEACKTPSTAFTSGPLIWSRR